MNRLVLQDDPKHKASAGKYRKGPVVVRWRHRVVYRPPGPELLPSVMQGLFGFVESERDYGPVEAAGLASLRVLKAHPFAEGNGRTARAVAAYMLLRRGYTLRPFRSIESYVDSDVDGYYTKLRLSTLEDPEPWLKYFARGVEYAFWPPGGPNLSGRLLSSATVSLKKVLGQKRV